MDRKSFLKTIAAAPTLTVLPRESQSTDDRYEELLVKKREQCVDAMMRCSVDDDIDPETSRIEFQHCVGEINDVESLERIMMNCGEIIHDRERRGKRVEPPIIRF